MGLKTSTPGHVHYPAQPAAGTAVTGGAANTLTTTAIQMVASTAAAIYITGVMVQASSTSKPTYMCVTIGTGNSPETIIDTEVVPIAYSVGATGTLISGYTQINPPVPVAISTRIACKTADSVGAIPWLVTLTYIAQSNVVDDAIPVTTVTTVTNQLTAAAIATGVWQDATSGDFTTTSSIGKSLYTSGVAPGGTNGLFIAGTNAATTVTTALTTTFTGNVTGSVASVSGAVGSVTGLTAADVGAIKTKTDFLPSATAGAAGGVFIAGSNAATSITTALTANITGNVTGNLTGSVGSVTGLTAATVHSDLDDIQARLPAALVGGRIDSNIGAQALAVVAANVTQIDGNATNGNNATLNLKKLNIVNSTGDAIVASATGSNGQGINASGNGSGSGIKSVGGDTGHGVRVVGGATSGIGLVAESSTSYGAYIQGDIGGLQIAAANSGHALGLQAGVSGDGINSSGGDGGNGARFVGGGSAGKGIVASGASAGGVGMHVYGDALGFRAQCFGDGPGIQADASGTGSGIKSVGGDTGHGMSLQGGATSGNGLNAEAQDAGSLDISGPNNDLVVAPTTPPTAVEIADEVATRTLDADVKKVNGVTIDGDGTLGNEWGPV